MSAFPPDSHFILTLSCTDQPGIVGAVGTLLANAMHCAFLEGDSLHPAANVEAMSHGVLRASFDRGCSTGLAIT